MAKNISLRPCLLLFAFNALVFNVLSQNTCGCGDCLFVIPDKFEGNCKIRITAAAHNDLAAPGQGLCGVRLRFRHEYAGELQFDLVSPAGQQVRLVSASGAADSTFGSVWDIRFVGCQAPAAPDPGHFSKWSDNVGWGHGQFFSGKYYPAGGCLEAFDLGPVVGDWSLRIRETGGGAWSGHLDAFELQFCDGSGLQCSANPPPPPPSEACAGAPVFEKLDGLAGSSAGFGPDGATGFCGLLESDQWLGFVAASEVLSVSATVGNCLTGNGLQMAIYEDCAAPPLACDPGAGSPTVDLQLSATGLVPGKTYFLVLDGRAGDVCDFVLHTAPATLGTLAAPLVPQGAASFCNASTGQYSIPPAFGATGYRWTLNGTGFFAGQTQEWVTHGPLPLAPTVAWAPGDGEICVQSFNTTDTSARACLQVLVSNDVKIDLPAAYLCREDLPWQPPFPHPLVTATGLYWAFVPAPGGCDSIFSVSVFVSDDPVEVVFQPVILFNNQCFTLPNGQQICDPGEHNFQIINAFGCTTTYRVPITKITAGVFPFACAPVSVPFVAEGPLADSLRWHFPDGQPTDTLGANPEVLFGSGGSFGFSAQAGPTIAVFDHVFEVGEVPAAAFHVEQTGSIFIFSDSSAGNPTQFRWDFGDGTPPLAGANQVHQYVSPGSYLVTLVVSNACGADTLSKQVKWMTIATETPAAQPRVELFPNPTSDFIFLKINDLQTPDASVALRDALGRRLAGANFFNEKNSRTATFDVRHFPAGLYFLEIRSGSWGAVLRVQKI